ARLEAHAPPSGRRESFHPEDEQECSRTNDLLLRSLGPQSEVSAGHLLPGSAFTGELRARLPPDRLWPAGRANSRLPRMPVPVFSEEKASGGKKPLLLNQVLHEGGREGLSNSREEKSPRENACPL